MNTGHGDVPFFMRLANCVFNSNQERGGDESARSYAEKGRSVASWASGLFSALIAIFVFKFWIRRTMSGDQRKRA